MPSIASHTVSSSSLSYLATISSSQKTLRPAMNHRPAHWDAGSRSDKLDLQHYEDLIFVSHILNVKDA